MRLGAILVLFSIATAATPTVQDRVNFERKWKSGETDKQRIGLAFSTQMGDVALTITAEQKVAKTFENGDAEVEVRVTELKVLFNGSEMPQQAPPTQALTMRMDKRGMLARQPGQRRGMGIEFLAYAHLVPDRPLKPGEATEIAYSAPDNPKNKVTGTIKFDSISDGTAKLIGRYEVWTDNGGDEPTKVTMSSWVRISDSKIVKAEGTFSNFRLQSSMPPTAAQFTMELIEK